MNFDPIKNYPRGEGVYIVELARPLGNSTHSARFYVGWTVNLENRMWHHRHGSGSRFLAAAAEQGIAFDVVLWIPGADKSVERRIKNRKNTKQFVQQHLRTFAPAAQ